MNNIIFPFKNLIHRSVVGQHFLPVFNASLTFLHRDFNAVQILQYSLQQFFHVNFNERRIIRQNL